MTYPRVRIRVIPTVISRPPQHTVSDPDLGVSREDPDKERRTNITGNGVHTDTLQLLTGRRHLYTMEHHEAMKKNKAGLHIRI